MGRDSTWDGPNFGEWSAFLVDSEDTHRHHLPYGFGRDGESEKLTVFERASGSLFFKLFCNPHDGELIAIVET